MDERNSWNDDDTALSALADGALPDDEAERLRRRIARTPELAERYEALRRVDEVVRATYGPVADEPLPQRVVDLLRPRPVRTGWFNLPVAAAAGLALVAGFTIAVLVLPGGDSLPSGLGAGTVRTGSAVYEVFQSVASGDTRGVGGGWTAQPRLTFVGAGGDPCRRVDLSGNERGLAAVACRRDGAWRLELVGFLEAGGGAGRGFRPAGDAPAPIDGAIDEMIDGPPLDREAEQRWIARGWD